MALQLINNNYIKIGWDNRIIQKNYTLTIYIYENKQARDEQKQPIKILQHSFEIVDNIPCDEVERIAFWYPLITTLDEYKDWINI